MERNGIMARKRFSDEDVIRFLLQTILDITSTISLSVFRLINPPINSAYFVHLHMNIMFASFWYKFE